ncbi:MAG: hypothetical protein ACYC7E_22760 [Armatimonadota bacterium]
MPYIRKLSQGTNHPSAQCAMYVYVQDNGRCQVEDFLEECRRTHPREVDRILIALRRAAAVGPSQIYDSRICKHVGGAQSGIYQFTAAPKGMLRVLWFYIRQPSVGACPPQAILLVLADRPDKGPQQTAMIERAIDIREQSDRKPFPLRD